MVCVHVCRLGTVGTMLYQNQIHLTVGMSTTLHAHDSDHLERNDTTTTHATNSILAQVTTTQTSSLLPSAVNPHRPATQVLLHSSKGLQA